MRNGCCRYGYCSGSKSKSAIVNLDLLQQYRCKVLARIKIAPVLIP